MSEGDIFREVEADLRREQLASYWQRYGIYVIAVALLIVLSVGGYQAWTWRQSSLAAADGAAFVQASAQQEQGELDAASQQFSALAEGGTGSYPLLADLRLAAVSAAQGEDEAAVAAYDKVAARSDDAMLRGFARIQAATLLVDEAAFSDIEARLEGMREATNPWRHSARELLAMAASKAGQNDKARQIYQELLSDRDTPQPTRQRAQMMLSLIDSPAQSAETAPSN
jgi:hypothetical protein